MCTGVGTKHAGTITGMAGHGSEVCFTVHRTILAPVQDRWIINVEESMDGNDALSQMSGIGALS